MDKFILNEKNYKKLLKIEKEKEKERKEQIYKRRSFKKEGFQYKTKELQNKYSFINDAFHFREKGDNLLNKWILKQNDPLIIFLSEFIPGTKISKDMEKFLPIIKTTPTISIEVYRKEKKIGEEGVEYLKRLRDKYGIIVLKVLWANLNFK
jgi:hypothetical protein